ncbi:tripartite tricarboxylate transporter substrate binding protein BugE [Cupriavidus sp. SZY C1]|uniref:tripartite tricarboxylate transporter substrate binding protein BugE n=1 Tax=Cupriavidus sp. SZY C1 TaxID=3055037 RepID=UPI0028BA9C4F|nr:tripartite tricarboxylate transporter substrate binding protein BugE [Cupriavidus sp. SZY C1]MDT6960695.1 tripartite tricarboxylate transporter substrate binding protein BugE [Cupriavidus sp. SZY C1]
MQAVKTALTLAIAATASVASIAHAQSNYPSKPIRLIIPFAPGGTTDIVGRGVADQMSRILGQPVVVENRAGGGGSIGADAIAKSAPDGYTIGISTVSTMAVNPACNPKLSYDPIKDFKPIANVANVANVIAVNPSFPAKDYKEFLAVLKANPGKYSYASSGTCGFGHMLGEQFKVSTKTFMVHIPYRGAGPALNDVLAGQVPIMVDNLPSSMPYIKAGKLRPIVVAWNKRVEGLPNVPTFGEMGLKEPNDPAWYGLVAPAGTPDDVIAKLNGAVVKALQDKGFVDRLQAAGAEPSGNSPAQHAAEIKKEFDKMKNLVKVQNIKLEQ